MFARPKGIYMNQVVATDAARAATLAVLERLNRGYAPRDFAVRFWDGSTVEPEPGEPARFTLVLNHPGALRLMLWPFNKASVGEAYIYDDIDLEGDLRSFFRLMAHWQLHKLSALEKAGLFRKLLALPSTGGKPRPERAAKLPGSQRSLARDQRAVQYHYDDPPSSFFALFLDKYMLYTCGYFADPSEDIDTAQERKLDYICRKLRLKPGERLIDIGCGWGGLITYAAKHYGVRSFGVTVCGQQVEWAKRRIAELGVGDRCEVKFQDYRELSEAEPFDKAVCVGLTEHLGEKMLPTLFGKVYRLLKPGGVYLHHGIMFRPYTPYPPWRAFGLKYVFPDGEIIPIPQMLDHLAAAGFEIRDTESLREHYYHTLGCWLARLEANHAEAVRLTDEICYRIHRIYLAGAQQGFKTALYNLHQTLVVKSGEDFSGLPLSRGDWYR